MLVGTELLSGLSAAILVADRNGHIVHANPAAERLLGYAPGALTGRAVEDLVPTRLRAWHQAARKSYSETPVRRELRPGARLVALCADGSELPVEIELAPVRQADGHVVVATLRALQTSADGTERDRARVAARGEIQAASVAVVGVMADSFQSDGSPEVAVGQAVRRCIDAAGLASGALYVVNGGELQPSFAFGSLSEQEPESWRELFGVPAPFEHALSSLDLVLLAATGESKLLSRAGAKSAILAPLAARGSGLGVLLILSNDGELESEPWCAFARALAAQLAQTLMLGRTLTDLSDAETWRRAVFDCAPDGMMVLGDDETVLECNAAACELFGTGAEQLMGREIGAILGGARAGWAGMANLVAKGGPARVHYLREDGRPSVVDVAASLVRSEKRKNVLMVLRDVEAQEQLLRADRLASVGMLAAGVAHEINNPLASAVANVAFVSDQLAEQGTTEPELAGALDDLREALGQVRSIVLDLRLFAGGETDHSTPVELRPVLEAATRLAQSEIRRRARVTFELQPVPAVLGDEGRIGQVFLSLIVNAAQAIREGDVDRNEIHIGLAPGDAKDVIVEVRDSGSGMPPEVLSRLFTPFFTTRAPGVGTGLGLSIAQRIVSDMGGTIEVESELGRGSTFRVRLPAAYATKADDLSSKPPSAPVARRARVLVIDDEATVARAIARCLGREHEVRASRHAAEALGWLRAGEDFDLILCDLMMPEMTGMELYAALETDAPAVLDRIVFLTGGAFTPAARDFLDGIPNVRVEKPFEAGKLRAFVRERLKRRPRE
jgi:PAS domain S-box-containing protein